MGVLAATLNLEWRTWKADGPLPPPTEQAATSAAAPVQTMPWRSAQALVGLDSAKSHGTARGGEVFGARLGVRIADAFFDGLLVGIQRGGRVAHRLIGLGDRAQRPGPPDVDDLPPRHVEEEERSVGFGARPLRVASSIPKSGQARHQANLVLRSPLRVFQDDLRLVHERERFGLVRVLQGVADELRHQIEMDLDRQLAPGSLDLLLHPRAPIDVVVEPVEQLGAGLELAAQLIEAAGRDGRVDRLQLLLEGVRVAPRRLDDFHLARLGGREHGLDLRGLFLLSDPEERLGDRRPDPLLLPVLRVLVFGVLVGDLTREIQIVLHLGRLTVLRAVERETRVAQAAAPVVDLLDVAERPPRLLELEARVDDGLLSPRSVLQVRLDRHRGCGLEGQIEQIVPELRERLVGDGAGLEEDESGQAGREGCRFHRWIFHRSAEARS